MKFNIIYLTILFELCFCDDDWKSPCESTENPTSYDDCKKKGTEYIQETCCFSKGIQNDSELIECVEVSRDDVRNEQSVELTKQRIIDGEYWAWDGYNLTYNSIEIFVCSCKNLFPKITLLILISLL